jgi:hypothetical protein
MFLYYKKGVISPELCNSFIETFEASDEKKPGVLYGPDGYSSASGKKSTDITFHPGYLEHKEWGPLLQPLIQILDIGLEDYKSRFEIAFDNYDPIRLEPFFNIQRYLPEEGFKTYHCERAVLKSTPRVLVWMVYLNTVTHKGETEFLYQHHFESPEQGKLVIWPADWTYTHRGIPSPTQTKYILTGWFSLFNIEENE